MTEFIFQAYGPLVLATTPTAPAPRPEDHPVEPSSDDCTGNVRGTWNGFPTMALWYPQMGGYVGHAVAVLNDCMDVYVWHDGEFPFDAVDGSPACVHHCDPEQFVRFGRLLAEFADDATGDTES